MANDIDQILFRPVKSKSKKRKESRRIGFLLYEAFYGPWILLKSVYRQLVVLLLMFCIGAFVFYHFEGVSPLVALLAAVSTITTIGLYVPYGGNFTRMPSTEAVS